MDRTTKFVPVSFSNTPMKASAVPGGRVMISSTAMTSAAGSIGGVGLGGGRF